MNTYMVDHLRQTARIYPSAQAVNVGACMMGRVYRVVCIYRVGEAGSVRGIEPIDPTPATVRYCGAMSQLG